MTTKELIRAEIERLIKMNRTKRGFPAGTACAIRIEAYERLLDFLDALPDEPVEKTCKTCEFYENDCPFTRGKFMPYPNRVCKDYTCSTLKAEQEPESEDERIIEKIIDCLNRAVDANYITLADRGKCLVYLEKQKEHQNNSDAREKALGRDLTFPRDKDKNLDEIAQDYVDGVKEYNPVPTWDLMQTAVCYGANWQKEQFKKNRLANCDAVSKEEIDRETDFAMEIIEKEHRQPTFNDAINYGMRLQKEQKPAELGKRGWRGRLTREEYRIVGPISQEA